MEFSKQPFLFSAIVGQEKLKTAYLANIVNPRIGGLLISGPKGTGKSTIVHSIVTVLPEYEAIAGCRFNCDPSRPEKYCSLCREKNSHDIIRKRMRVVNLPLSCTEDRLIGSIDIERLLKAGEKKVEVGILGEANRNILYIDEVNLLPDHLVDDILDAAASPWNTIEREGISITHPADFILVGTMNPEEGELRPQILDRFPLNVKVESINNPRQRVEIVKRNLLYENNPKEFNKLFADDEEAIGEIIVRAKGLLEKVQISELYIYAIAEACGELKVDGQRPDIVIVKTGQTIAALDNRLDVSPGDIMLAAEFALSHRTRDGGLLGPPTPEEIRDAFMKYLKRAESNGANTENSRKFTGGSSDIDKTADSFIETSGDSVEDIEAEDIDIKKKRTR